MSCTLTEDDARAIREAYALTKAKFGDIAALNVTVECLRARRRDLSRSAAETFVYSIVMNRCTHCGSEPVPGQGEQP